SKSWCPGCREALGGRRCQQDMLQPCQRRLNSEGSTQGVACGRRAHSAIERITILFVTLVARAGLTELRGVDVAVLIIDPAPAAGWRFPEVEGLHQKNIKFLMYVKAEQDQRNTSTHLNTQARELAKC